MAKNKLDWFKLDCHIDDKLELIIAEFGLLGFAVVVRIWQKIYGGEGYYCEWNEDVALVFAKNNNVGASAVSEIVARCIKRGIFDERLFRESSILTSHGIQQRYIEVANRRKGENKILPDYLLLCNAQNSKDVDISSKNVDILSKNVDISKQKRKEEKRKEEKRVEENNIDTNVSLSVDKPTDVEKVSPRQVVNLYHEICRSLPKTITLSENRSKAIKARLRTYGIDSIKTVFLKAESSDFLKGKNDRNWSASFDWLMKDGNFAKVLDGKYDNRDGNANSPKLNEYRELKHKSQEGGF